MSGELLSRNSLTEGCSKFRAHLEMDDAVPTTASLEEIYAQEGLAVQQRRWDELQSHFEQRYGRKPQFISRSPGRVNIIGEVSRCDL